jgi:CTP synthase
MHLVARLFLAVTAGSAGLSLQSAPSRAQAWPQHTIRVIVPLPPGTPPDITARIFAEQLSVRWKQPVIIENIVGADGILVPGGFGNRGTRGMMIAARVARERGIPYFGICYGFQWATVEYARNVAGLTDADSTECNPDTSAKVIYKLRDLLGVDDLGGTMRLGSYACELAPGSLAQKVYGATTIDERHRHRYEFNCLYERTLSEHGLKISGRSPDGKFVEIAELPGHPWYLAVQFHPEFKSKPTRPHPLFAAFVAASYQHKTDEQPGAAVAPGIRLRA